ncbi:nickel-dependent hydrogenase, large subunit, partial [Rhodopirellula maiorica SM1]
MSRERNITVNALTRVEGEGALHIQLDGDEVEDVRLSIYEPPRFFEALLRGRAMEEVPDITARICGICPVAYQMTSVHALETALGITVTPEIRSLRRLLYCGEWIESHTLHVFLLHAPDFFGSASGIELARQFPQQINDGLRIKKVGNSILEIIGGRAIHPVNVRIGGFHRLPSREELTPLLSQLQWAFETAIELADWIAGFPFPCFDVDGEWVALSHPDEYPMNAGRIASTRFPTIDVDEYEQNFVEEHAAHSTALQSTRRGQTAPYFLGPLSRLALNRSRLSPQALALAEKICPVSGLQNRFHSILARIIEIVSCLEESIAIIQRYKTAKQAFMPYVAKTGFGCAATEAPRGLIYHHYGITDDGLVSDAKIVPPTSQNQRQIESDLKC